MDKLRKIIYTLILVLLIGFIAYIIYKEEKKYQKFKQIQLTEDNKILNRTHTPYLDTIVDVGLKKLGIKNVKVILYPLTDKIKINFFHNDFELKAHIRGINNQYVIWIDEMSRVESIQTLSHELIHLKQYNDHKLVITEEVVYWNDEIVNLDEINYGQRPWEIEAFSKQNKLTQEIKKELFD